MRWFFLEKSPAAVATDEEITQHLRLTEGGHLQQAKRLLSAAEATFETYAETAVIAKRMRVYLSPPVNAGQFVTLPVGPALSAVPAEVRVVDNTGVEHPVDAGDFTVVYGPYPSLRFADDAELNEYARLIGGRVEIDYTAGSSLTSADVPADIKMALLDQASLMLDHGHDLPRGSASLSPYAARVAARYRGVRL